MRAYEGCGESVPGSHAEHLPRSWRWCLGRALFMCLSLSLFLFLSLSLSFIIVLASLLSLFLSLSRFLPHLNSIPSCQSVLSYYTCCLLVLPIISPTSSCTPHCTSHPSLSFLVLSIPKAIQLAAILCQACPLRTRVRSTPQSKVLGLQS